MKVYVAQTGSYDGEEISGVYATLDAARAAHPIPTTFPEQVAGCDPFIAVPGGWKRFQDEQGRPVRYNGLDWNYACHITEYEVQS